MFNSEHLLYDWRKSHGCCGCCGTHYTTLTDNRLLTRFEEYVCCSCCCDPAHNDSSIFLYDIAQLLETTEARGCLGVLFARCCVCCSNFCCGTKRLELRGSFSSHIVYISTKDVNLAKPAIAEAIARHKPNHQH